MPAATQDRGLGAFPERDRGVAAPPQLLQLRDWSRPTAPPRSGADERLRKQTAPFLFRRSFGKSAACLPSTSRQANLVLPLLETADDRQGKPFPRPQRAESCRSVATNRSIQLRDRRSPAQSAGPCCKISVPQR